MIGYLRGSVIEKNNGKIVLLTDSGVGYVVKVSPVSDLWREVEIEGQATVFISHQIRENEEQLFGFASAEERDFFEQLITVSGVGPKLAATLLAHVDRVSLAQMIMNEDAAGITAVPGIGKKTAERLIVELRDKVFGTGTASAKPDASAKARTEEEDILDQALSRLGFSSKERKTMLSGVGELFEQEKSMEDILKMLLSGERHVSKSDGGM